MNRQRGFTLMELMIVIVLIVIIAAIAVPSIIEAKMSAHETAAVGSIRMINTAELSYQASYGGFADSLSNLGGAEPCNRSAETACLLDESLAGGVKAGYVFAAVGSHPADGENTAFEVGAAPLVFNRTGRRLFCATDKNVIRADLNTAGSTIPPGAEQCATFKALR